MNLLPKTIVIIGISIVIDGTGKLFSHQSCLLESYATLEELMLNDVQIIHNNLLQEAQILEEKLADWSKWDDSYKFAPEKPNKSFIGLDLVV
ncbi:MAG: hypothetical protein R3E08_04115 [Thiotrichaceae bacterium]